MSASLDAREALFVESLGEMAALVQRVETLLPALQDSRQSLLDADAQLSRRLHAFEAHIAAVTEHAKMVAVNHIAQRTTAMTGRAIQEQALEMREAARTALGQEIRPTLEWLMEPLNRLAHHADKRERTWTRWQTWLTHVAATAAGSALSWLYIAIWLWLR